MCNRRPKQCENPVASGLHNIAVVAADSINHQLERRIDDRLRLFGVEILYQLYRTLDIGKQCGDRLALAVDRSRRLG